MQNLKIAIYGNKPGWLIILKQIGVSFEQIDLQSEITVLEYSVVIICSSLDKTAKKRLTEYLQKEGSVLFESEIYAQYANIKAVGKNTKFLISERDSIFSSVGLVDTYSKLVLLKNHKLNFLDEGLHIYEDENTVIIPFNINELVTNTDSVRKKFYAFRKELPSEIVSKVSKGKLRKIIEISLKYLHHKRDLPFVNLYHSPFPEKNIFIFRLDTDYCSQQEADKIKEICYKHDISATWFLDTDSQAKLEYYAKMDDQELGIHCNKHLVYNNFIDNYNNLQSADKKLRDCNIFAKGFAAPFGDWNCSLDRAMQKTGLEYSSEFALDYDDLPFYPFCGNKFSQILQIPIHPISLGRLRRSHFNEDEMLEYYLELLNNKYENDEPVIIYHHPHHQHLEIFDKLFRYVNLHDYENLTMQEFCNWWKKRYDLKPEFQLDAKKLKANYKAKTVLTKISTKRGYSICKGGEINLEEIPLKAEIKHKNRNDENRIRKFHWRDILYDYETKRSKKHFLNN